MTLKKPKMHSYLKLIKPYKPGKPVEEVERELGLEGVIKLASNENPLGPPPVSIEAMKDNIDKMHIYPDGNCYYLRRTLAEELNLEPEQLIFGNGSDEILSLISKAYFSPGDEILMVSPSFSEYDFAARLAGAIPVTVPLTGSNFLYDPGKILKNVSGKTKAIFICSPNNPTGSIIDRTTLDQLIAGLPEGILIILDQAYIEYVDHPDHPAGLNYLKDGYPVLLLRTFSKIFGLAGLRIGYAMAPVEITADLNRVREPFNVNAMAQAAALAALGDTEHLAKSRQLVRNGRLQLEKGFAALGLKPVPDQANFCFVDLGINCGQVFQALLERGVIVRTGDIFGFPTFIRVTYGTTGENNRLLEALAEVLKMLT